MIIQSLRPTPIRGAQPPKQPEVERTIRSQREPSENHERPRPAVLDDRRHPRQRRNPEEDAALEPAPCHDLRIDFPPRQPEERRQCEKAVHPLSHRRKRRPQQKPRQEPEERTYLSYELGKHLVVRLLSHSGSQLKSNLVEPPSGVSNVRGTGLVVTHSPSLLNTARSVGLAAGSVSETKSGVDCCVRNSTS